MMTLLQSQIQRTTVPPQNASDDIRKQTSQVVQEIVLPVIKPVAANLKTHEVTDLQVPSPMVDLEHIM